MNCALPSSTALLSVCDLDVRFAVGEREVTALNGVSLEVRPGEIFGLIGETGAGKSLTAWAALDILPHGARRVGGEVRFAGENLSSVSRSRLRKIRGGEIGIVGQNAVGALDPTRRIGRQLADVVLSHRRVARREAWRQAVEGLRAVGIPDPERRARAWPHELSGGMAQRVLIAMAIINGPRLLIADEPTTGLDVTVQAEILDLLGNLVHRSGMAIWMITHDLGVIANYCERAGVMFAGEVVETASTRELFSNPKHPYTMELLDLQADTLDIPGGATKRAPPDLSNRPKGCQFQYRCPIVRDVCLADHPRLLPIGAGHEVRCFAAPHSDKARGTAHV